MAVAMRIHSNQAARAALLLTLIAAPFIPAAAQYTPVSATAADPGAALADAMHKLATQPKELAALLAAGRASLDLGDMQAAAGFFGRAEEYYPASPAAKIGIGAAMTLMGDAKGAMTYFDQASALGAPQSMLALDRGLAFDLLGQQGKAQSDYRSAMSGAQADEARRRLALSLAISKDIKGAAAILEPLLVRRDAAAVRTNAFVLALAGDREGARRTIDAALPGAGARFEPFFRMLPVLRADEKAMAVHLGEFPKDAAQRYAQAQPIASSPVLSIGNRTETVIQPASKRVAVQMTPPKNAKPKPPVKVADAVDAPRRAVRQAPPPSTYLAMVRPSLDPSRYASKRRKVETVVATPKKAAEPDPEPRPGFESDPLAPVVETAEPLVPVDTGPVLNKDGEPILTVEAELPPPPPPTPKLEIKRPPPSRPKVELVELTLRKPAAKAKAEPAKPKPEPVKPKEAAKKKEPASPYFVQLASGAHADRMGTEFKRIKAKKPSLFAGRTARVTNGKDLFRLVIGPFKTRDESGEFINQLAKAGIDGFTYTAPDGMTFEKITAK
jgi:tetratricopeptide (TPR) repeat protein